MKVFYSVFIFSFLTACGGSNSRNEAPPSQLSQLPERALSDTEINEISFSCDSFDVSNNDSECIAFLMRDEDYDGALEVDIAGFSEQDLMERLELFFPDPSLAPNIVIFGDGLLEEGLINNGFNLFFQ